MFEKIREITTTIKTNKPLILNITNDVTIEFVANGLLSLNASPVMSKATQEIEELMQISAAVVINLGTLHHAFIQLCAHVCQLANQFRIPIILDPVGAGASKYRTESCKQLIDEYDIAIIRGNGSEIMALSELSFSTKGVDSLVSSESAIESARAISKNYDTVVVVSGKDDFVVDAKKVSQFNRGSSLMTMVTGTGCLLSAVLGAFHAVEKNTFNAASAATLFYSVCGEVAARKAQGPGSFKTYFLDAIHATPEKEDYEK